MLQVGIGEEQPPALEERLSAGFRAMGGSISECRTSRGLVLHADYVPDRGSGWVSPSPGRATALAGDLVLAQGAAGRRGDLEWFDSQLDTSPAEALLRGAAGTFSLCHYNERTETLLLATDSLGGRPMYWMRSGGAILFSTSFRLLTELPGTELTVDWQGVAEHAAFCYPLGTRTLIEQIHVLRDGEQLRVQGGGIETRRYWKWEETVQVSGSAEAHSERIQAAFLDALAGRQLNRPRAAALLSGGLDSRCIVGGLLDRGCAVEAINCGRQGWQDREYAERFAELAGVSLKNLEWIPAVLGVNAAETTAGVLHFVLSRSGSNEVFSGDGGGETVGFLMMKPKVMELLGAGQVEQAIQEYVHGASLSTQILDPETRARIAGAPARGMAEEFAAMPGLPGQKTMQLFLIRNDMRRHLHAFFERSESLRTEALFPFYDRRVLEAVLSVAAPLDEFLGHRLYYQWLEKFRAPVSKIPWQSYPGHAPCPLPGSASAAPQWDVVKPGLMERCKEWRDQALARALGGEGDLPGMSRARVIALGLLSKLGAGTSMHHFRDYLWAGEACLAQKRSRGSR
jgi:hypothetical protein